MSRWQIKSVLFYSHDSRRIELEFKPNDVTIIVGESYSGKSAIIEAIDYAMGASQCHIPGIVRETCSWVGVLWVRDKGQILICRRVPELLAKSSEDVHFSVGAPVELPATANDLVRSTNVDGALRRFEQAILLANVVGMTYTEREGNRISIRNAMPYVLVSDDVIIDKLSLFRGMKGYERQSIIDSIPYFTGAVDEKTAANEIKLRKLRTKLAKEERRREADSLENEASLNKAKELLREATEVGLIAQTSIESITSADAKAKLEEVAKWTPGAPTDSTGADQLTTLYSLERSLLADLARHRTTYSAAKSAVQSVDEFATVVEDQKAKLNFFELFNPENHSDLCPLCNSSIADKTPSIQHIRAAFEQLDGELREVGEDRPQIDAYIQNLDGKIDATTQTLKTVRGQISAIVREAQNNATRLDDDPRRMRVVGRVSFFLDETAEDPDKLTDTRYQELLDTIKDLESLVDPEGKADRINGLQLQVSGFATELLRNLPFDVNYRNAQVMFDARKLILKFVLGQRVMEMRDVGGDESYLSGRLSTLLALHRVFAASNRPVPGVIILDQVSRPFYNPETTKGEVVTTTSDSIDLKRYFDVIFKEVEEQKTLQVIVLEHAYFNDDAKYQNAVTKRWGKKKDGKERLIPYDWPRITVNGTLNTEPLGDE